jgi:hypothetical protein
MPVSLPGSASSWSGPWRSASTPSGVSYYYNGTTGTWRQYNSTTDTTTTPTNASSPSTSQLSSTFSSRVTSANTTASGTPVTATSTASTTAATSTTAASTTASGGTPYYPLGLAKTKQDRIKFTRREGSQTRSLSSNPGLSPIGPRATGASKGEVYLGIQGQITDSNGADWSGMTLNPIQARAAAISIEAMKDRPVTGYGNLNLTEDLAAQAGSLMGKVMQNVKSMAANSKNRDALQILLAQEAVQAQGLLSRLTGQVANPNLELLFNGPTLRPFSFTFRMAPRDAEEAQNVKKIIRFFKQGMAPSVVDGEIFLSSPDIFEIQFQSGETNSAHPSLPRIKPCALIGCDVNYTPDGSYMTFEDPANGYPMTCYEMTLRFSEIVPVYSKDYDSISENDIGF